MPKSRQIGRRSIVAGLISGPALAWMRKAAESAPRLVPTPHQTEGPYYPIDWSGDIDADLVALEGASVHPAGQVAHLSGRILDLAGEPIPGARIDIWQCDGHGVYRHPADNAPGRQPDPAFQGHGRTISDATGRYAFRTLMPRPYPGRAPHIHVKVVARGGPTLTTQLYVHGDPANERDGVLRSIRDPRQRESVIVRFEPADAIEPGARAGTFDIVMAGRGRRA
jgi:protocatechuate 3,4-dioxygenase beta subunit